MKQKIKKKKKKKKKKKTNLRIISSMSSFSEIGLSYYQNWYMYCGRKHTIRAHFWAHFWSVSNAWNHWLFINSTAYIDQSNDGFYAHMEKWNPEDLFIYRPQYLLLRTYLMINSTWLSWLYCQPFSLPDSGTGALATRAGHLLDLPVLSDRPTVFVKTEGGWGAFQLSDSTLSQ